jgi:hypothetical protein
MFQQLFGLAMFVVACLSIVLALWIGLPFTRDAKDSEGT